MRAIYSLPPPGAIPFNCIRKSAGIKIKPSGNENIKGAENHACGGRDAGRG
jgi:hypothetical protein